jgi:hypothetical protein
MVWKAKRITAAYTHGRLVLEPRRHSMCVRHAGEDEIDLGTSDHEPPSIEKCLDHGVSVRPQPSQLPTETTERSPAQSSMKCRLRDTRDDPWRGASPDVVEELWRA